MIVNIAEISRVRLHNDVIVMSYEDGWCFFDINGKRIPIAIHGKQTLGYRAFNIEEPGRGLQQPFSFGGRVRENVSGGRESVARTTQPISHFSPKRNYYSFNYKNYQSEKKS